jgi:hypothetical protein
VILAEGAVRFPVSVAVCPTRLVMFARRNEALPALTRFAFTRTLSVLMSEDVRVDAVNRLLKIELNVPVLPTSLP